MPEARSQQNKYMKRALELARKGWGDTHPNPMVGAVIVIGGKIVAEGWHRAAGEPHAEIEALRNFDHRLHQEATLYITLEPCSTVGRTGACTSAIIASGIPRVMIGTLDPNPAHRGRGIDYLRQAGIEVSVGIMEETCADLNLIFNHSISRKTPLLAAKIATTLDGKFSAANGHSKWITGESARKDVMHWRRYFPAIAGSASTVLTDNPKLTSRLPDSTCCPRRFIFDRTLDTLPYLDSLHIFKGDNAAETTLICDEKADPEAARRAGLDIWQLPVCKGHLDLDAFRTRCIDGGINGVYIEPGPRWASALLKEGQIDYLFHYLAPKYLVDSEASGMGQPRATTSIKEATHLQQVQHHHFEQDLLIRGWLGNAHETIIKD